MARPLKMSADWFPHQANSSSGRTVAILENRFGTEGYAAWFKLLEIITSSRNHVIDARNPDSIEFLAARMRLQPDRLGEILAKIAELGAIDKDLWAVGVIWCQNLVDNLASLYDRRRQDPPHKPEVSVYQNPVSADQNPVSAVRNTTEEGRNIVPPNPPKGFDQFWSAYPKKRSKGQAEKAFAKIHPDEQLLATMIAMIERAKKSDQWIKKNGEYIPHPATWLNAKGWEDEITTHEDDGVWRV